LAGEAVGSCDCHSEDAPFAAGPNNADEPVARVAGVRFRDSGRVYYFDAADRSFEIGEWVVVETSRGQEAGRVIIAPHQVRLNLLQGELKPIQRRLDDADVQRMAALKRAAATAIKTMGAMARASGLPVKPISADYSFDGAKLVLNYALPDRDRPDLTGFVHDLADEFRCEVELRQVGPREEARLLGGLGRCGRTLCCSSWLPVFPEISMNMAKTQDLPINPSKVSGVCGRLLCCLSYENEQYKQMKAVMPRLGQPIETPAGQGTVISMQVLREVVNVRLDDDGTVHQFPATDLGLGRREAPSESPSTEPAALYDDERPTATADGNAVVADGDGSIEEQAAVESSAAGERRRRRRRGRGPRPEGGSIGGAKR
jgi:cell fate regulator YaaT (PSP1 superfamily)